MLLADGRREKLARRREGEAVDESDDGRRQERRELTLVLVAVPKAQRAVARTRDDDVRKGGRRQGRKPARAAPQCRAVGERLRRERPLAFRRPEGERAVLRGATRRAERRG